MTRPAAAGLVLSACIGFAASSAQAATWQLLDASFDDGTLIEGSFDYTAATNTYANWHITVLAGSFLTAYTYQAGVDNGFAGSPSSVVVDFVTVDQGRYLRLAFPEPLTDAGGFMQLVKDGLSFECDNCSQSRFITSGAVSAVPEPGAWGLFGLGLLGLAARKGRRSGSAAVA